MSVESPWYFAYGSNLAQGRLEERVGAVTVGGQATLAGHRLSFHKPGRDGSGKCTISPCGDVESGDCVFGVIYALSGEQAVRLDRFEGPGYRRELVDLVHQGRSQVGYTYVAPEESLDPSLRPFDWYHTLVVTGAGAHGLPAAYVCWLDRVAHVPDPDRDRATRNLAALSSAGSG